MTKQGRDARQESLPAMDQLQKVAFPDCSDPIPFVVDIPLFVSSRHLSFCIILLADFPTPSLPGSVRIK